MTKPVRIQRQRTKGWKMPPNTVYVGRPSRHGNPFRVICLFDYRHRGGRAAWGVLEAFEYGGSGVVGFGFSQTHSDVAEARGRAVAMYRAAIDSGRLTIDAAPLRGKNLACWCPLDQPCHADVLLELANATKEAGER